MDGCYKAIRKTLFPASGKLCVKHVNTSYLFPRCGCLSIYKQELQMGSIQSQGSESYYTKNVI